MKFKSRSRAETGTRTILIAAIGAAALFWVIDSAVHAFIFHDGSFSLQLQTFQRSEVGSRLLAALLITAFAISVQIGKKIQREAEAALRREKAFSDSLIETAQAIVLLLDTEGRIVHFNPYMEEVSGYRIEEVRGRDWFTTFVRKGDQEQIRSLFLNALGNTQTRGNSNSIVRKDGSERIVEWYDKTLKDADGNVVGLLSIGQDITERKRAEEILQESEENFRGLAESITDVFFALDRDLRYVYWNRASTELIGIEAEDALGKSIFEVFPDNEETRRAATVYREVLRTRKPRSFLNEYSLNGKDYVFEISAYPSKHGIAVLVKDITERRRMEEALQESEERYRTLTETAFDGQGIHEDGRLIEVNQALADICGYEPSEMIGMHTSQLVTPECWKVVQENTKEGFEKLYEVTVLRKDGSTLPVELVGKESRYYGRKVRMVAVRDITERKAAEQALRESRELLQILFDSLTIGIYRSTPDGQVLAANPAMLKLMGYSSFEELAARNLEEQGFEPSYPRSQFKEIVEREGEIRGLESAWVKRDGSIIYIRENARVVRGEDGKTLYYEGTVEDITEHKKDEQALEFERRQLLSIFDGMDESVYVINPETHEILYANAHLEKSYGRRLVGEICHRLFCNADTPCEICAVSRILQNQGRPCKWEFHNNAFHRDYSITSQLIRWPDGHDALLELAVDITDRKEAERKAAWQQEIVTAINAVLGKALACESEEDLARTCLEMAQDLVGAKFGYFCEVNSDGKVDALAISNPGWDECKMPESEATKVIKGMEIRGMQFLPLLDGRSRIFNDPSNHPQSVGLPKGHPEITCLLAVPLKHNGRVIGQIALGNKEGGYDLNDQGAVEALSGAMVEALTRKRAEGELRASELRYRTLFEQAGDYVLLLELTPQGEPFIVDANRAALQILGYSREEILGRSIALIDPDISPQVMLERERLVAGSQTGAILQVRRRRKDGSVFLAESAGTMIRIGDREVTLAIERDITERMRAEAELRASEANNRAILNAIPDLMFQVDRKGTFLNFHASSEEDLTFPPTTFLGKRMHEIFPEKLAQQAMERIEQALKGRQVPILEYPLPLQTGEWRHFEARFSVCAEDMVLIISRDITQRKQADKALQESEARFEDIALSTSDWLWEVDSEGVYTYCSEKVEEILGYAPQEMIGKTPFDFMPPEEAEKIGRQFQSIAGTRAPIVDLENWNLHKDGRLVCLLTNGVSIVDAEGTLLGYRGADEDITERKRAEEALRESEAKYRSLIDNSNDAIYLLAGNKFEIINHKFSELFGVTPEEANGPDFDFMQLVAPRSRPLIEERQRMAQRGETPPARYEFVAVTKKGEEIEVETSVTRIPYRGGMATQGILRDITERKKLEAQLLQVQKMEAVGQLAAGIAHEINTPIQYVGDNARFLKDAYSDVGDLLAKYESLLSAVKSESTAQELVREIEATKRRVDVAFLKEEIPQAAEQALQGVGRVARIVHAMKQFSHPGLQEKESFDLNRALEIAITIARNEWKYVAEMVTDFDSSLPPVPCVAGDMNQVFLNVLINAAQAVAEVVGNGVDGKGTIKVSTHRDGDWAEVRIADTGTGIPATIRNKVFDPFFTTKEVGKGTGQGLAIVHAIVVNKHHGTVTFETTEGEGTTFVIRLPIHETSRKGGTHETTNSLRR
jgi:PAS domain S-box-containing protein